jgi:hypothetical protein
VTRSCRGALGDINLGDDVLEVGPGYGATTDVLAMSVPKLTAVEIDEELATMLSDRFANNDMVIILREMRRPLSSPMVALVERHRSPCCTTYLPLLSRIASSLRSPVSYALAGSSEPLFGLTGFS